MARKGEKAKKKPAGKGAATTKAADARKRSAAKPAGARTAGKRTGGAGTARRGGAGTRAAGKGAAASKKTSRTQVAKKEFIPNIVVFACNWCSYAGADNAGVNRIQYSPNFRVIRTMCSGRVTPAFVLKAFKLGADGVLVSGCHFGDCHYIFGNYRAVEQFEKTKDLVRTLGLKDGRIRLEWVSAAEGTRWGEVIDEFVQKVTELGPSPLNHSKRKRK